MANGDVLKAAENTKSKPRGQASFTPSVMKISVCDEEQMSDELTLMRLCVGVRVETRKPGKLETLLSL